MTHLNLLPWRELRRKQLDRQIINIAIGVALLAGGLVYLGYHIMNQRIDEQKARNAFLQSEITKVEKELKEVNRVRKLRANLIARMEVIQKLQSDRTRMVKLFDGLAKNLPKGMYLTSFQIKGKQITLAGSADSNGTISKFMRQVEGSDYFTTPDLNVIRITDKKGTRSSNFTMKFNFKNPKKKKDESDGSEETDGSVESASVKTEGGK